MLEIDVDFAAVFEIWGKIIESDEAIIVIDSNYNKNQNRQF